MYCRPSRPCSTRNTGHRILTNSLYFVFRCLATMSLSSVFILMDAQTIEMCSQEEEQGRRAKYGRQVVYKTVAQVGCLF